MGFNSLRALVVTVRYPFDGQLDRVMAEATRILATSPEGRGYAVNPWVSSGWAGGACETHSLLIAPHGWSRDINVDRLEKALDDLVATLTDENVAYVEVRYGGENPDGSPEEPGILRHSTATTKSLIKRALRRHRPTPA